MKCGCEPSFNRMLVSIPCPKVFLKCPNLVSSLIYTNAVSDRDKESRCGFWAPVLASRSPWTVNPIPQFLSELDTHVPQPIMSLTFVKDVPNSAHDLVSHVNGILSEG